MRLDDLLTALAEYWEDAFDYLDDESQLELSELVQRVVTAADDQDDALEAAFQLAPFLLSRLPVDHPVVLTARSGYRYSKVQDKGIFSASLLARLGGLSLRPSPQPETGEIWDAARRTCAPPALPILAVRSAVGSETR